MSSEEGLETSPTIQLDPEAQGALGRLSPLSVLSQMWI